MIQLRRCDATSQQQQISFILLNEYQDQGLLIHASIH
jgi:hypothetical protein